MSAELVETLREEVESLTAERDAACREGRDLLSRLVKMTGERNELLAKVRAHATAADALDALAVPGVADVLLAVAAMHETPGTQEHRDALAALAKIARGE